MRKQACQEVEGWTTEPTAGRIKRCGIRNALDDVRAGLVIFVGTAGEAEVPESIIEQRKHPQVFGRGGGRPSKRHDHV